MDDKMSSPNEIVDSIEASEAYQIHQRLLRLDTNLFVFDKNYQDLKSAITTFKKVDHIHLLWDATQSDIILRHIIRFFHNYVASAKTLVDHTRLLINEWYKDTPFLSEYKTQIATRFLENILSTFIEDLRNYTLHYSLPLGGLSINVTIDKETNEAIEDVAFFVEKTVLLKWSNWQKGKAFLEATDERIFIEDLTDEYYKQVIDFHTWIHNRLIEIHATELQWMDSMQNRLEELLKPLQQQALPENTATD